MGEYAIRNSDGKQVKIGTCESMYYLRFEDRGKVKLERGSGFGWYWRIPFPDEDDVLPGEYQPFERTVSLGYGYEPYPELKEGMIEDRGVMQFSEHGLLLNVPCYHGLKLPETGNSEIRVSRNGGGPFFALKWLRSDNGVIHPVVGCVACGHAWREEWKNVLPHIHNAELQNRLEQYAPACERELTQ